MSNSHAYQMDMDRRIMYACIHREYNEAKKSERIEKEGTHDIKDVFYDGKFTSEEESKTKRKQEDLCVCRGTKRANVSPSSPTFEERHSHRLKERQQESERHGWRNTSFKCTYYVHPLKPFLTLVYAL